jgi:amino acid adenylation domain-containing protein
MYLIYTSGSTGLPKGVIFPHRAFVNLLDWQFGHSRLVRNARTVQFATFGFCVSFLEIFAVLCSGSTLVMVPEEYRRDMEALWKHLEEHEIERLHLPFAALKQLADVCGEENRVPRRLREVVTSGEQLQVGRSIRSLFTNLGECSLTNQYGTSEIHVVSSFRLPEGADGWPDIVPVGRPVANSQIYLLDPEMRLLPVGVLGELYAGGACLARGYLGAPAQTAAKFVPDPFAAQRGEPGARLYRTGDLARQLPDGRVEWYGRIDNQVRIRGFRVELGEVETAVKQHLQVRNAAVLCRPGPGGAPRLIAYVVPHEGDAVPDDLRAFLKAKLPEHMVPALVVPMANLPLNANGKLDFEAFPDPAKEEGEASFVAPSGPVEEMVAQILARILNTPRIGAHDSFFELGGHSLLATQVANRIRRNFAIELPLRTFFEGPTVAELARAVVFLEAKPGRSEKIARAFLKASSLSGAELEEKLRASQPATAPGTARDQGPAPESVVRLSADEGEQMRRLWEGVSLDPYADFESFVLQSKLVFHQMPERLRRTLLEFGRRGNLDSALLLQGLPQDPALPPTPIRSDQGTGKATFASELWLCAVAAAFGEPIGYLQEKRGNILQDLFPTPASASAQSSESSSVLLAFHTEAAFHPFMPDYVLLYGLRQDPHKEARTMFASVRRFLHLLSPEDQKTLFSPVFRTGIDYSFGNTTGERGNGPLVPVLYGDWQDPFMRYDLDLMVGQTPAACRALEVVCNLINEVQRDVVVEPGSLLVLDNRRCVHARSVFRAAFDGRDRWLQRLAVVRDLDASVQDRVRGTRVIATDFSSYLGEREGNF